MKEAMNIESVKNWNLSHDDYKIDISGNIPWLLDANFVPLNPLDPKRFIEHANQVIESFSEVFVIVIDYEVHSIISRGQFLSGKWNWNIKPHKYHQIVLQISRQSKLREICIVSSKPYELKQIEQVVTRYLKNSRSTI